jgi:hypothetical protein
MKKIYQIILVIELILIILLFAGYLDYESRAIKDTPIPSQNWCMTSYNLTINNLSQMQVFDVKKEDLNS